MPAYITKVMNTVLNPDRVNTNYVDTHDKCVGAFWDRSNAFISLETGLSTSIVHTSSAYSANQIQLDYIHSSYADNHLDPTEAQSVTTSTNSLYYLNYCARRVTVVYPKAGRFTKNELYVLYDDDGVLKTPSTTNVDDYIISTVYTSDAEPTSKNAYTYTHTPASDTVFQSIPWTLCGVCDTDGNYTVQRVKQIAICTLSKYSYTNGAFSPGYWSRSYVLTYVDNDVVVPLTYKVATYDKLLVDKYVNAEHTSENIAIALTSKSSVPVNPTVELQTITYDGVTYDSLEDLLDTISTATTATTVYNSTTSVFNYSITGYLTGSFSYTAYYYPQARLNLVWHFDESAKTFSITDTSTVYTSSDYLVPAYTTDISYSYSVNNTTVSDLSSPPTDISCSPGDTLSATVTMHMYVNNDTATITYTTTNVFGSTAMSIDPTNEQLVIGTYTPYTSDKGLHARFAKLATSDGVHVDWTNALGFTQRYDMDIFDLQDSDGDDIDECINWKGNAAGSLGYWTPNQNGCERLKHCGSLIMLGGSRPVSDPCFSMNGIPYLLERNYRVSNPSTATSNTPSTKLYGMAANDKAVVVGNHRLPAKYCSTTGPLHGMANPHIIQHLESNKSIYSTMPTYGPGGGVSCAPTWSCIRQVAVRYVAGHLPPEKHCNTPWEALYQPGSTSNTSVYYVYNTSGSKTRTVRTGKSSSVSRPLDNISDSTADYRCVCEDLTDAGKLNLTSTSTDIANGNYHGYYNYNTTSAFGHYDVSSALTNPSEKSESYHAVFPSLTGSGFTGCNDYAYGDYRITMTGLIYSPSLLTGSTDKFLRPRKDDTVLSGVKDIWT